ncbi:MAG: nucleoside triphosphate pyrophosphohydrolase [Deltaproteobacteria bacterium]|nr:nucleoside triphosphate pyrophosphohydrolase [Deltaproteobacteria bacterium]
MEDRSVEYLAFEHLVEIVRRLRKECPWDREQTFESVKSCVLEEAYEVIDALSGKGDLPEELGDLLLQPLFITAMAEEKGVFGLDKVIHHIADKLVRRHPHVFGEGKAKNAEEVLQKWASLKRQEKGAEGSHLDGVPSTAPTLLKAYRLSQKASRAGFDWPDRESVRDKCEEEWRELLESWKGSREELEEELGDLLFTLCNLARFSKIDPEQALEKACQKFSQRFRQMEKRALEQGQDLKDLSPQALDTLWNQSKS